MYLANNRNLVIYDGNVTTIVNNSQVLIIQRFRCDVFYVFDTMTQFKTRRENTN